jgi:hypothetical protein
MWTKIGDEWPDVSRDLTDAEHRTHVDALCWSNRRLLDLRVPKRDLRRFAESPDAEIAVKGLMAKGWWEDLGDCWDIGLVRPEWQLESAVIEHRRAGDALRQRRHRMHDAGDHSLCTERCPFVTRDATRDATRDPGRGGSVRDGENANHVQGRGVADPRADDAPDHGPGNGKVTPIDRARPTGTEGKSRD